MFWPAFNEPVIPQYGSQTAKEPRLHLAFEHNGSFTKNIAKTLTVPAVSLIVKIPIDNRGAIKVLTRQLDPTTYHQVILRFEANEFEIAYTILSDNQVKGL